VHFTGQGVQYICNNIAAPRSSNCVVMVLSNSQLHHYFILLILFRCLVFIMRLFSPPAMVAFLFGIVSMQAVPKPTLQKIHLTGRPSLRTARRIIGELNDLPLEDAFNGTDLQVSYPYPSSQTRDSCHIVVWSDRSGNSTSELVSFCDLRVGIVQYFP
jgi:hypothetical protein